MCDSGNDREITDNFDPEKSIHETLPDHFNLAEYLLLKNKNRFEKTAFYHPLRSLTYSQLRQFVPRFAALLQALNGRREERVIILLPDSPEFVITWLGTVWHGQIAVPINEAVSLDDIAYMLDDSRASIVITTIIWQEKLKPFNLPTINHWVLAEHNFLDTLLSYSPVEACPTHKDEAAFWSYTSGSTGRPKGVIHAHYSPIVACVRYAVATLGLHQNDIVYTASPMAFTYGLGTSLYMPLFVGASAILTQANNAFAHIDIIHTYRPTILFAIPHHYAILLAAHEIFPLDASSIRLAVSAAEQLSPHLWTKWKETYGLNICEGIGTTESTHIFISNRPENCVPGSSGTPVTGYEIRLRDEASVSHSNNMTGQLQVTGEGMMLGYWNRLRETQVSLHGKSLFTTDLYRRDEEGHYYFLGRKDDTLKIAGMWIIPGNIEHTINACQGIQEVAIIVVPSQLISETFELACYWVAVDEMDDEIKIISAVKKRLNQVFKRHQLPKQFIRIARLPRTCTGKVDRKQLQIIYKNK